MQDLPPPGDSCKVEKQEFSVMSLENRIYYELWVWNHHTLEQLFSKEDWKVSRKGWMDPCMVRFWAKSLHSLGHWRWNVAGLSSTTIPNTPWPWRNYYVKILSRFWSVLAMSPDFSPIVEGVESPCCPATAPKTPQSLRRFTWKTGTKQQRQCVRPEDKLQETFDLSHWVTVKSIEMKFSFWPSTFF